MAFLSVARMRSMRGGVDGPGIEVEVEAGHVFAEDLDLPPRFVQHALHDIGNHHAANALHRDLRQRARRHDVAHENVGVVADDDMSGLGDRLRRAARLTSAPMAV